MEPFNINSTPDERPKRSFLLWFLAICTMINAGMNAINYMLFLLFPRMMEQTVEAMQKIPAFSNDTYSEVFNIYLSISGWQYGLLLLVEIAIFVGALLMLWKLKSIGFHIYTIGQIVLFGILNFVIGGKLVMSGDAIIVTVCLILLYASQLKYMDKPEQTTTESES